MQDIFTFMQTHWALSLTLGVVLILLIILEFIKQKKSANSLSPTQATQLINRQDAVVLDVRSSEAYATGHIIDSVSIPANELNEKSSKIDKFKSKPLILVCAAGLESQKTAALLQSKGFTVNVLNGGLRAWKDANMPLVKS